MVTELMKQPQYSPMSVAEMSITLLAVNKGYFDDVEVKQALAVERQLHAFLKEKHAGLVNKIEATKDLDADSEQALAQAIEAFKATLA
jgi:F-type H+-transporting ATPase subunit alpha